MRSPRTPRCRMLAPWSSSGGSLGGYKTVGEGLGESESSLERVMKAVERELEESDPAYCEIGDGCDRFDTDTGGYVEKDYEKDEAGIEFSSRYASLNIPLPAVRTGTMRGDDGAPPDAQRHGGEGPRGCRCPAREHGGSLLLRSAVPPRPGGETRPPRGKHTLPKGGGYGFLLRTQPSQWRACVLPSDNFFFSGLGTLASSCRI